MHGNPDDAGPPPPVADPATGEIRILSTRCTTCVLNPAATAIRLAPGRRKEFIRQAREKRGHVVCHNTLPAVVPAGTPAAMCRGFAEAYGLPPAVVQAVVTGFGHLVAVPEPPARSKRRQPDMSALTPQTTGGDDAKAEAPRTWSALISGASTPQQRPTSLATPASSPTAPPGTPQPSKPPPRADLPPVPPTPSCKRPLPWPCPPSASTPAARPLPPSPPPSTAPDGRRTPRASGSRRITRSTAPSAGPESRARPGPPTLRKDCTTMQHYAEDPLMDGPRRGHRLLLEPVGVTTSMLGTEALFAAACAAGDWMDARQYDRDGHFEGFDLHMQDVQRGIHEASTTPSR